MSIKSYFKDVKKRLVEWITQDVSKHKEKYLAPNPLTPMEKRRRDLIKGIYDLLSVESLKPKFSQFNTIVRNHLEQVVEKEKFDQVIGEFNNSNEHMKQYYEKYRASGEVGKRGVSLAEILGISNPSLLSIYSLGNHLLREKRHTEAMALFEVLMLLRPRVPPFWVAVGVALDSQRRFVESLKIYKYGKCTFPVRPSFPVHLAQCYINQREKLMASSALDDAEKLLYRSEKNQKKWGAAIQLLKTYTIEETT